MTFFLTSNPGGGSRLLHRVMTLGATLLGIAVLLAIPPSLEGPPLAEADEDLGGTYVLFQQTATVTKLPVLKDVEARTRSMSIHRLVHEEDRLFGAGRLCDLRIISSSRMVRTILPEAFKRLVMHVPFDAKIQEGEATTQLVQDSPTLILGARLENPLRDPLPTNAKDSRIFDQDRDGQPGVTVRVEGLVDGDVYIVQRSKSLLVGKQEGTAFKGKIEFENEQKVIGATSSMLERDPRAEPMPEHSYFVLQKVAPGTSCSEARRLMNAYPK